MKKKRLHLTTLLCLIAAWMLFTTGCKNIGEEPVYYTVTFDSDGGSDVPAQTVESGKTAVEPRSPTKQGHNFVAWYNGNTEFNFKTPVTSDLTLKAKWTPTDSPDDGEGRGDNDSDTGEGSEQDDTIGSGNTTNPDNKDDGDGEGGGDNGSDTGEGSGQDDATGSGNTTHPDNKDDGDIDDTPAACEVSASQLGTLTSADLAKDEFGDTYTIRLVGAWTNDELRLLGLKLKDIPDSKHITLDMTHTTGITKLYDATAEEGTFYMCIALTAVLLPNTLKTISDFAFGVTSLVNVVIPDSVETIDDAAFLWCSSLENVMIGNGVKSIGINPFAVCASLKSITVSSDNPNYYSKNNCLIETATKTLVSGCASSKIPSDVTTIKDYAFYGCTSLASVEIPDSVTNIKSNAFLYCTSLEKITFKGSTEQWNAIKKGESWHDHTPATKVTCIDGEVDL